MKGLSFKGPAIPVMQHRLELIHCPTAITRPISLSVMEAVLTKSLTVSWLWESLSKVQTKLSCRWSCLVGRYDLPIVSGYQQEFACCLCGELLSPLMHVCSLI